MRFVAISDTHNLHSGVTLPHGDVLIHAGDVTMDGTRAEAEAFLEWFSGLPHQHKIFIAGNHDFYFEQAAKEVIAAMIPDNLIYLNDSGVEINGIKIWGSPVQPWYMDYAFNRQPGADIRKHWDLIPADTDVLITHGPVSGIHDITVNGNNAGCADLKEKIQQIKPRVHVCGHIHGGYGVAEKDGVKFINASTLNEDYKVAYAPVIFDL